MSLLRWCRMSAFGVFLAAAVIADGWALYFYYTRP